MPNWCENRLVVRGDPRRVEEFDRAFKGRPAPWPLAGYEKHGKTAEEVAELEAKRQQEWAEQEPVYCFNALYPVPEEVLRVGYSVPYDGGSLDERLHDLFDPQKWRDGYSWCVSHWGTKWDVDGDVVKIGAGVDAGEGYVEYGFDTAWSPPCPWLERVAGNWPDLKFELVYYEGGVGFAGRLVFEGGRIVEDCYVEGDALRAFVLANLGFDPHKGDE